MTSAQDFFVRVKDADGKCLSYSHGNESGVLWEHLWKYEGGVFLSKVCAPGCFVNWEARDDASALRIIEQDLKVMRESQERSKR